ncbi:MAG: hypothetical protein JWM85_1755 [Acidimicrobiaceae bacterium]|nr:hypothetical protein [Acidimicrobiaceae bacterium]
MTKEPIDVRAMFPEIERISDPALAEAVVAVWERLWAESPYESYDDVRVSTSIDYPQLKHCRATLLGALALADVWEQVHGAVLDRDVVIAAALLMDASKMVESQPDPAKGVMHSELGRALPHAVYAAHLALGAGISLAVVHVILSHSPNGGKAPNTLEAELLHWVDQADIAGFGFDIWRRKVVHYQP